MSDWSALIFLPPSPQGPLQWHPDSPLLKLPGPVCVAFSRACPRVLPSSAQRALLSGIFEDGHLQLHLLFPPLLRLCPLSCLDNSEESWARAASTPSAPHHLPVHLVWCPSHLPPHSSWRSLVAFMWSSPVMLCHLSTEFSPVSSLDTLSLGSEHRAPLAASAPRSPFCLFLLFSCLNIGCPACWPSAFFSIFMLFLREVTNDQALNI